MSYGMALIMQPTYACNAACSYCSVHKLGDFIKPMKKEDFSELTNAIQDFFDTKQGDTAVTFYWLGGEPLIVPDSFYQHVEKECYESRLAKKSEIYHNLQSNLTPLAKKDAPAMKRLLKNFSKYHGKDRIHISTSFDPVSDTRVMKNDESYNELFMEAFFKLKKENASIGGVYTVHRGSIGHAKEIYNFFKNIGNSGYNLNAMSDYQGEFSEENLEMVPKEYGEFLIDSWKAWEEDKYTVRITPFESWRILYLKGDDSQLRCHNDGVCNLNLFASGPDGNIYDCDRAIQAYEKPLGNFKIDTFEDMQKKKTFQDRILHIKDNECDGCKWWEYCKGGCPYESKGQFNDYFDKSHWCESYKMLFEYMDKSSNIAQHKYEVEEEVI